MSKDHKIYSPSADWTVNAHINSLDKYKEMYNESIEDPDAFLERYSIKDHLV